MKKRGTIYITPLTSMKSRKPHSQGPRSMINSLRLTVRLSPQTDEYLPAMPFLKIVWPLNTGFFSWAISWTNWAG